MSSEKKEGSLKWSLVVGFTVVLAGITSFMVVKRQEIFPGQYQKPNYEQSHSNPESDTVKTKQTHH
jgi:hypothetical protein